VPGPNLRDDADDEDEGDEDEATARAREPSQRS
jgi:hypothetical protein